MDQKPQADPSLSVSQLVEIDKICRQFEAAWKAGKQPKVDDFLGSTPEPQRAELRRELESIDAEYRKPAKEVPSLETFVQRLTDSGLIKFDEYQAFYQGLPADHRPQTAEQLAQELFRRGRITKFQAQAVYQGKTRGLVMGNYVVLDQIGKGGMGFVYKAKHRRMDRIVALKMLPATAATSKDSIHRFQREAKAAAKLSHPNIVTAHDADEAQGMHFLVMEYVDGKDLSSLVKQGGPLAVATAVDYVLQAAKGLDYAHGEGVIHRDIKPANLLLDKKGVVKILDMGLARLDDAVGKPDDGLTRSGQVMGTLDFMAPEQALDTHQANARSDIYSLGCTLYYLLAGRAPFTGETVGQKIVAHREQPVPSLRAVRTDVPESVEAVFQKMLAKRPEDRQPTMAALIAELQKCPLPADTGVARPPVLPSHRPETLSVHEDHLTDTTAALDAVPEVEEFVLERSVLTPRRAVKRPRSFLDLKRLSKRQKIGLGIGLGTAFFALLFGVIISLRTPYGTLIVEVSDPDVTVQVLSEEGTVQIERKDGKERVEISVDPGKHRLRLKKGNDEVFAKDFTITSGGKETITARWERAGSSQQPAVSKAPGGTAGLPSSVVPSSPIPAPAVSSQQPAVSKVSGGTAGLSSSVAPPPSVAPFDAKKAKEHQEAWAKHLNLPVEETNSIGMKFVLIPPGEFQMGSTPEEIEWALAEGKKNNAMSFYFQRVPSEAPRHWVRISKPFYLAMYPVTQAEYEKVMGINPSAFTEKQEDASTFKPPLLEADVKVRPWARKQVMGKDTSRHPVETVNWDEAVELCRRLSEVPANRAAGRVYRLPTEAEWEYACRAGTTTRWYCGDDEAGLAECAWFEKNADGMTHPVGRKKPNAWGLYDVYGNISQWCADWNSEDGYKQSAWIDPAGPPSGRGRAVRGGNSPDRPSICRSAFRGAVDPAIRRFGFRVVVEIPVGAESGSSAQPTQPKAEQSSQRSAAGSQVEVAGAKKPSPQDPSPPLAIAPGHGLRAELFTDDNLQHKVKERVDRQVDWLWCLDAPNAGIPAGSFSIRWTGWLKPPKPGRYRLATINDDGARLMIDGKTVIDDWEGHYATRNTADVELTGQPQPIRIEYQNREEPAVMSLRWVLPGSDVEWVVPPECLFCDQMAAKKAKVDVAAPTPVSVPPEAAGTRGLLAEFFAGVEFGRKLKTRVDYQIDWLWAYDQADPAVPVKEFSARWSGRLTAPRPGTYRLTAIHDDGVRIWLDGRLVIEHWSGTPARRSTALVELTGKPQPIRIEYFQDTESHLLSLRWIAPGETDERPIPASAFSHDAVESPHNGAAHKKATGKSR